MTKIFLSLGLILGFLAKNSEGFCAHGWGGIGEYHKECPDSAGKIKRMFLSKITYLCLYQFAIHLHSLHLWSTFIFEF